MDLARDAPVPSAATLLTTWDANADGSVSALVLDANYLDVGGTFATIGGETRANLAKLAADAGTADPVWNPGADANVDALILDGRGLVYVTGGFGTIGGQARQGFARLPASDTIFRNGFDASGASVPNMVSPTGAFRAR